MSFEFSFLIIMVVTLFTPGPNNTMLVSSGYNFGFKLSQPHAIGVSFGFFTLLIFSGIGLAAILAQYRFLAGALQISGFVFLIYLSYGIALTKSENSSSSKRSRMGFIEAFVFQFINPKALTLAFFVQSTFFPEDSSFANVFWISLIYAGVGIFSSQAYILIGVFLNQKYSQSRFRIWINPVLGGLLALTTLWMAYDSLEKGL